MFGALTPHSFNPGAVGVVVFRTRTTPFVEFVSICSLSLDETLALEYTLPDTKVQPPVNDEAIGWLVIP